MGWKSRGKNVGSGCYKRKIIILRMQHFAGGKIRLRPAE